MADHWDKLAGDFTQTVLKAVLLGWALGSGLGFAVAVAIDRQPFLQRGLLPLASLTSTIPLVAVAPIAVMWFGFDWPSKAAVVVLMTFFPMLVSTLAGLQAAGKLERELMHSYAASYSRTLLALRLPAAVPFIFGALKVNATLALIGAIVAEFFGSPTSGLGFRISHRSLAHEHGPGVGRDRGGGGHRVAGLCLASPSWSAGSRSGIRRCGVREGLQSGPPRVLLLSFRVCP